MDPSPPIHARAAALGRRWCVAYLVLHVPPFPFDSFPLVRVPGVLAVTNALLTPWHAWVAWVGESVFSIAVDALSPGVTDTAYNYVAMICVAALALVIAVVYPFIARTRELSGRVLDRARAYAALYVGVHLLPYGWHKVIPLQMSEPGPDRLIVPFGDMSPMGVLWTFMGTSPGYEMMTGLVEALAATLLFWRRTRLLGALLAAVAMVNVVALNFGYFMPLKLFSVHLLALALFVLSPDARRLLDVILYRRAVAAGDHDPHPVAPRWRWAAWSLKLALLLVITSRSIVYCVEFLYSRGALAPEDPLHGIYRVVSFTRRGDAEVNDEERWIRVGLNRGGAAAIQRADGHGARYGLKIDEARRTLVFTREDPTVKFEVRYTETPDGALRLVGTVDAVKTIAVLRKVPEGPSPAKFRFRWLQSGFVNQ